MSAAARATAASAFDPYERLRSWVYMCADKFSPWLHFRSDKYTVVDCVTLRLDESLPAATAERIRKALGSDADDRIVFERTRYDTWVKECHFEFAYTPLDLVIDDSFAYFEDSLGRRSRWTFLIDDDGEDCGPAYMTGTAGAETIPWLLCIG